MLPTSRHKRRSFTVGLKRRSLNRSLFRKKSSEASSSASLSTLHVAQESCIKVVVRSRPFNDQETGRSHEVVSLVDEKLLVFDPPRDQEDFFFQGQKQTHRDLNKKVNKNVRFMFDRVFDGCISNEQIFNDSIQPLLDSVISGFNCSVFAYGATGAGKTFTMLGTQTCPGITYLIVKDLFRRVEEIPDKVCEINVSYLEVYNETVKDLFRPSPPLLVRDDSKGVMVPGLSYQKPTSAEELLKMLHFGNRNRSQHPTDANAESSRSHAVFQIYLKIKYLNRIQLSKMSLIDLAGSERACVVSNRGKARMREGANINQSLLALGSCINALADKKSKIQHVPYRNSKLTRILKDSLGGNCKTIMIAAISPSSLAYEDTYNTLKYADRAKGIKVTLNQNIAKIDAHITEYKTLIDSLQKENSLLKRKLDDQAAGAGCSKQARIDTADCAVQTLCAGDINAVSNAVNRSGPVHATAWVPQVPQLPQLNPVWTQNVDSLYQQLLRNSKDVLDSESQIRSSEASLYWTSFSNMRLCNLTTDNEKVAQSQGKLDTCTKNMQSKVSRLLEARNKNLELFHKNKATLTSLLAYETSEAGKLYVQDRLSQLKIACDRIRIKHATDIAVANLKNTTNAWKLCEQSLKVTRKQQLILKGHNFLSSDLVSEFAVLLKQAECGKEVAWADIPVTDDPKHQEFMQQLLLTDFFSTSNAASSMLFMPEEGPLEVPETDSEPEMQPQEQFSPVSPLRPSRLPMSPIRRKHTTFVADDVAMTGCSYSVVQSPVSPKLSTIRHRQGSPHPTGRPNSQKTTRELLDMLNQNAEQVPVRRSLQDTYINSTQAATSTPPQFDALGVQTLGNLSCSPASFQNELTGRPSYAMSTPCLDRPRTVMSSIIYHQEAEQLPGFPLTTQSPYRPEAEIPTAMLSSQLLAPSIQRAYPFGSPFPMRNTALSSTTFGQYPLASSALSEVEASVPEIPSLGTSYTVPERPLQSILKKSTICSGTTSYSSKPGLDKVGTIQPMVRTPQATSSSKSLPRAPSAFQQPRPSAANLFQLPGQSTARASTATSGFRAPFPHARQSGKENVDLGKMGTGATRTSSAAPTSNRSKLPASTTAHRGMQKSKSASHLKPKNK